MQTRCGPSPRNGTRQCVELAKGVKKALELETKHLSLFDVVTVCVTTLTILFIVLSRNPLPIFYTKHFSTRHASYRLFQLQVHPGIRKVYVLCAFAKIAKQLGCYKTARLCYHQLAQLKILRGQI